MGVPTCELNLESADNALLFDEAHYGLASETVQAWIDEALSAPRQAERSLDHPQH